MNTSFTIWFTGLSGSGKTTLSKLLKKELLIRGKESIILDGDNIRASINADLDFSSQGRTENIRRVAEIAKTINENNIITITALITPTEKDRNNAMNIIGTNKYIEIFLDSSLETCEKRDVKGLYKKARENKIENFTGISATFEKPKSNLSLKVNTEKLSVNESIQLIMVTLNQRILDN